ncbi:hypothetical protein ACO0QE_000796 [Hanseniaspora vineae]
MQLSGSYKSQPFKPPKKAPQSTDRVGKVKLINTQGRTAPVHAPNVSKTTSPNNNAKYIGTNGKSNGLSKDQKYCSLMYRKYTTKKNKTWDGDAYGIYSLTKKILRIYKTTGKYIGSTTLKEDLNDEIVMKCNGMEYQLDYFIEPSMNFEYKAVREALSPSSATPQAPSSVVPSSEKSLVSATKSSSVKNNKTLTLNSEKPNKITTEGPIPVSKNCSTTSTINKRPLSSLKDASTSSNSSQEPVKKQRVYSKFQNPLIVRPLTPVGDKDQNGLDSTLARSNKQNKPNTKASPLHNPLEIENALVMNNKDPDVCTDVVVDPLIGSLLRPHQREGVKFMYDCIMQVKSPDISGCLLADEMGLGKTLMTITVIWTLLKQTPLPKQISQKNSKSLNGEISKVLIICPVTLIANWKKEFKKWIGLQKIGVLTLNNPKNGSDKDKQDFSNFLKVQRTYQVLIMSYEKTLSLQSIFSDEDINQYLDLIVCDEAHRLKNNNSKILQILKTCDFKKKILLTGTPIQNDLNEFFTIIDFLNPGIAGSYNSFKKTFINPITRAREMSNVGNQDIVELGNDRSAELIEMTSQFVLRRTNDILNKYLPPKTDYIVFCKSTPHQVELAKSILVQSNINLDKVSFSSALGLITLFKKLCNSPALIESDSYFQNSDMKTLNPRGDTHFHTSGKLAVLHQLLETIKNTTNDKIVIISNYTQTLDIVEDMLRMSQLTFVRLDGSTPTKIRDQHVQTFNTIPSVRCFLLSAKSGGVGLNLIGGNRLILFDNDWNPAIDAQAMGRVHRDGQKKPCYIYRLVTAGFIDEKILQRQLMKINLSKQILKDSAEGATGDGKSNNNHSNIFEQADLKDLFTIRTDTKSNTHDLICGCTGDCQAVDETQFVKIQKPTSEIPQLGFIKASEAQSQIDHNNFKSEMERKLLMQQCLNGYKHIDPHLKDNMGSYYKSKLKDPVLQASSNVSVSFILEK